MSVDSDIRSVFGEQIQRLLREKWSKYGLKGMDMLAEEMSTLNSNIPEMLNNGITLNQTNDTPPLVINGNGGGGQLLVINGGGPGGVGDPGLIDNNYVTETYDNSTNNYNNGVQNFDNSTQNYNNNVSNYDNSTSNVDNSTNNTNNTTNNQTAVTENTKNSTVNYDSSAINLTNGSTLSIDGTPVTAGSGLVKTTIASGSGAAYVGANSAALTLPNATSNATLASGTTVLYTSVGGVNYIVNVPVWL